MSVYSDQVLILQVFGCGGSGHYSELKNRVGVEGIVKHAPITENKGKSDKQRWEETVWWAPI